MCSENVAFCADSSTHGPPGDSVKVLVTGAAGFIGMHVSQILLARGDQVVGLDNLNDYYEPQLKHDRLARLTPSPAFSFVKMDVADRDGIAKLFAEQRFDRVVHLAAQAGVRYSIENPHAYIDSNIVGFTNILEGCRHRGVQHLAYASSSSVYGGNPLLPLYEDPSVEHPSRVYAATETANVVRAARRERRASRQGGGGSCGCCN